MNQREYDDLRGAGFNGALNDMKASSTATLTTKELNDAIYNKLRSLGFTGTINDVLRSYALSLGYTGSINDAMYNSHLYTSLSVTLGTLLIDGKPIQIDNKYIIIT